jgi:hypothetical protein
MICYRALVSYSFTVAKTGATKVQGLYVGGDAKSGYPNLLQRKAPAPD